MIAGSIRPSRIRGPIYELRAVVTHYGRHENGHYICYRKHPVVKPEPVFESEAMEVEELDKEKEEGQWWRLSDDDVTKSSEENVLGQGGVFMLFYDCIEPSSVVEPAATLTDEPLIQMQEMGIDETIPEDLTSRLPPDPSPSSTPDSTEPLAAATIALPDLTDSDLSEDDATPHEGSIATATSISEYDDDEELVSPDRKENNPYKPAQAIVVPQYVPQSGGKAQKDGKGLQRSNSNLVMV
jgi:ubiquitin carboxyl-terminal hydrolase 1